jgi:cobalt-zinc-cadmium efflux system membrane fusion protein
MVPRVPGIVRQVAASVGENLKKGDLLAVIDSRELADAKSKYLAAKARAVLADTKFQRESELRKKQISSEQDYLDFEQALAEAKIELRSTEQQLHALGLSEDAVRMLDGEHGEAITRYEVRSPIDGIVTEKHISLGESLEGTADIFTLVDMSSVWINLTVYTKNLSAVRNGTDVRILTEYGVQGRGEIFMVTPFVEESTRTATARVVMDNSDGSWIPGTFVTGSIGVSEEGARVVVPKDAVQSIDGESIVFVDEDGAFVPTQVETGRSDRNRVEIVAGLRPGVRYAAGGAFELKATIITSTFDAHAGHGH